MHIEPGFVSSAKIILANVTTLGLLAKYLLPLVKMPTNLVKTLFAALFFSIFMESFNLPVGPSELHFVGAMPIYILFGFLPTIFGFSLGLLLQGLFFNPQDLLHIGINSLSLIVPLIVIHYSFGSTLNRKNVDIKSILKLDSAYYGGVTLMVGFWLFFGYLDNLVTNSFGEYILFASSYIAVVIFEPLFTYMLLRVAKTFQDLNFISKFTQIKEIKI